MFRRIVPSKFVFYVVDLPANWGSWVDLCEAAVLQTKIRNNMWINL